MPLRTEATDLAPTLASRVATAPISWGVCELPGWGHQLPVDRVLSEMADLGFTHTELGSPGWLPQEAAPLRHVLEQHGLSLLASFVPLVLHQPELADDALDRARRSARLLADAGGRYFNTAPVRTYDWQPRQPLSDDGWQHLFSMTDRLDEICEAHGLHQVVHEHLGTMIETKDDVERLLAGTKVDFVLDTGHLALGGFDPVEFATDHSSRVGLVHLKDVNLDVGRRFTSEPLSLMDAVQAGLFPALGLGDLPISKVVETLEAASYSGWYVVEQDCAIIGAAPDPGLGPKADVAASLAFLQFDIPPFSNLAT